MELKGLVYSWKDIELKAGHEDEVADAEPQRVFIQDALVAYGGAGPMHAIDVANLLGINRVVAPLYPGIASAYGLLEAFGRLGAIAAQLVNGVLIDQSVTVLLFCTMASTTPRMSRSSTSPRWVYELRAVTWWLHTAGYMVVTWWLHGDYVQTVRGTRDEHGGQLVLSPASLSTARAPATRARPPRPRPLRWRLA